MKKIKIPTKSELLQRNGYKALVWEIPTEAPPKGELLKDHQANQNAIAYRISAALPKQEGGSYDAVFDEATGAIVMAKIQSETPLLPFMPDAGAVAQDAYKNACDRAERILDLIDAGKVSRLEDLALDLVEDEIADAADQVMSLATRDAADIGSEGWRRTVGGRDRRNRTFAAEKKLLVTARVLGDDPTDGSYGSSSFSVHSWGILDGLPERVVAKLCRARNHKASFSASCTPAVQKVMYLARLFVHAHLELKIQYNVVTGKVSLQLERVRWAQMLEDCDDEALGVVTKLAAQWNLPAANPPDYLF